MGKQAVVIGATGLVGVQLVELLLEDERFAKVRVLGRRPCGVQHPKLDEHVIQFDDVESYKDLVRGDVFFSTLGTTLKHAGSKEAQYKVDYTYQYEVARAAAENGVPCYVLVSSVGASAGSMMFYPRIKGELERDTGKLGFQTMHIMQPGPLEGDRKQDRPGERFGLASIRAINKIGLFRSYRPIHGRIVAQAMINVCFQPTEKPQTHVLDALFRLAEAA